MAIQFTYPRKNNPDSSDLLLIADSQNYWRTRQITIEDIAAAVIPGGYTLPTASTTVLGGVRIDGDTINIDGNGAISVSSSVGVQSLQQVLTVGNETGGEDIVFSDGDDIEIQTASGSDFFIKTSNGENLVGLRPDNGVMLYYNNVKQVETTNYGFRVGGTLRVTGFLDLFQQNDNTFAGTNAGNLYNTNGNSNAGFGENVMSVITTASQNTGVGFNSLKDNTSGNSNTSIGAEALNLNTAGSNNTAVGRDAISSASAGAGNTAVGSESLKSKITSNFNTAVGYQSLNNLTTGFRNTAIGNGVGSTLTTGSRNIIIGDSAQPSAANVVGELTIGDTNINSLRIPGLQATASDAYVLTYSSSGGNITLQPATGGGSQNLQQVTDVGATTNNDISLDDASLKISDDLGSALIISGIGSSMSFGDANTIANSLNSQGGNLLISGNTADGYSGNSMPNSGYSNFIMGEVNIFSSNSDVFSNYNSIHGYGNDVNNLSHSLVVGNYNTTDSIVSTGRGYLGCTMLGDYNNLTGTEAAPGAHLIGYSLTANQPFVTVVGSFNTERTPEYSGTYNAAANFNNGLFARFVVGIGDIGGGAGGQVGAVRRDGFVVLKNGTVTADSLTTTIIDAESTGRVLVTREWIEDNISRESPFLMTATAGGSQTYTGSENIIYLNWSGVSGIYSITLPSAADIPYREIKIVSDGSLNASDKAHVLAPVGESIDGQLNPLFYTLNKAYNGVTVWSDGSNWIVTQAKAT